MGTKKSLTIPADAVIGKFCYSYSVSLLRKLEDLIRTKRVFLSESAGNNRLTAIANTVIAKLMEQISYDARGYGIQCEEVLTVFVATVREFLEIFEVQE